MSLLETSASMVTFEAGRNFQMVLENRKRISFTFKSLACFASLPVLTLLHDLGGDEKWLKNRIILIPQVFVKVSYIIVKIHLINDRWNMLLLR